MTQKTEGKNVKKGCAFIIAIVVGLSIFLYLTCESEPDHKLTKQELHQKTIDALFSGWDGSHIELTKLIKKSLNDPKSYEHIETTYVDNDSTLTIKTIFTANNSFGGTLKKEVIVKSDTLGNIIEVYKWID